MGISRNVLLAVVMLGVSSSTQLNAVIPDSLSKTEQRTKTVFDTVSPAVVRVEGKRRVLGSGIILTPEGHILTRDDIVREHLAEETTVILKDGRRLTAKPLGWSGEWKVGLLKVQSETLLSYVPLGDKQTVAKAGQGCVAIGYPKQLHAGNAPIARYGCVSLGCDTMWCTATCPVWSMGDFGAGLFDLEGRLLGICAAIPTNDDALFTLVDAVKANWAALESGKNLDVQRLLGNNITQVPPLQTASTGKDVETAKAATVLFDALEDDFRVRLFDRAVPSLQSKLLVCLPMLRPPIPQRREAVALSWVFFIGSFSLSLLRVRVANWFEFVWRTSTSSCGELVEFVWRTGFVLD